MNKTQMIDAIAQEAGITKVEAKKMVDTFLSVTTDALKKGDKVTLLGFGTFSVSDRPARQGRNPRTGAAINIDAKKTVKFKPGAELNSMMK